MMDKNQTGHLLRVLGVAFGIAVVIGGMVGQGILRTPGLVAQGVPSPVLIITLWTLAGVFALIDSMSTVELATSIRKTGGPYIFVRRAFGRLPGLAIGITDWLANVGTIAFVSVVFGEYLHRLGIGTSLPIATLGVILIACIGLIQWFGTKIAGRSQEVGSAIKAVLFCILIVALFLAPRGEPVLSGPLATTPVLTLTGVIVAVRAIFGTYAGWNGAAYFCEEVRNPTRDIVRATFVGIALVTGLYVVVNIAFLNVMTPAEMAGSNLVAADAATKVFGASANTFVTAVSLISLVTITNVIVMIFPRVVFAVARDAGIPGLNQVAANGTPRLALIVTVGAGALLATVGVYDILLAFSSSLLVLMGAAVNLASIVLRRREPDLERPWRMPLFPLPAILALIVNASLLIAFIIGDPATVLKGFALMAVLTGAGYLIIRRTAPE